MSSSLSITREPDRGRVTVLRVAGRLDSDTAQQLLAECSRVQAEGHDLVLNLAGVSFVGSSGVGALLVVVEQFREQSGQVRFAAVSKATRTVVDLLDLQSYLPIDDDEDDALRAMGA